MFSLNLGKLRAQIKILPPFARNPGGVRFGSSELYDVVEACFKPGPTTPPGHVIVDCLAVGHSINNGTDERVILFIKLDEGFTISDELERRIRTEMRARRSARHVPAKVSYRRSIRIERRGACIIAIAS